MKKIIKICLFILFMCGFLPQAKAQESNYATFVQILRKDALKTVSDWQQDMEKMQAVGIDTIIVQWCAFGDESFIKSDKLRYRQQYDIVPKIMEAAGTVGMDVYLGLTSDHLYWNNVTLKDVNLEDYFLLRVFQSYEMAEVLKELYKDNVNLKGFYIPDEIDDKTWRGKRREKIVSYYLDYLSCKVKGLWSEKEILISVFFRLRTAPADFAKNMHSILTPTAIDKILLQDGVGVDIKNLEFVTLYAAEFIKLFGKEKTWGVVEVFKQVQEENEFTAEPAEAVRIQKQIANLKQSCAKITFFSFIDYMHPKKNKEANLLYQFILKAKEK